ncbi:Carbohydrate esterase 4 protein [Mortierella sp. AD094]|nr:Carbohydrate esterase 4 protein [Mortierella sp. AD094]
MRFSHSTPLCKLSVLGCILATLTTLQHSSNQASAAPIRQPIVHKNLSRFPYPIKGPEPSSHYRPGQVLNACIQPNSYAISFDDGPGQLTDELLDFLDEQRVKVTFFMNGDNWNCIYSPESRRLLKRAFNSQHQIAAHPWSHRDFEFLTDDEIRQEMNKIEHAFRSILGVVPRYMRPPYGEHSKRVRKIMEEMGYIMILWDVDELENDESSTNSSDYPSTEIDHDYDLMPDHSEHEHDDGQEEEREVELEVDDSQKILASFSHKHQTKSSSFSSKWAEAVRGVPFTALDRDAMVMGGIYQEATSVWAVEYVQSLGFDIMPVGACVGESDPRLWYKEIVEPANEAALPTSCHV